MTTVQLRAAIPGALGADRVAVANVWDRDGAGLSLLLVRLDQDVPDQTLAVGDVVALPGGRWELTAIDPTPDRATATFVALVTERGDPADADPADGSTPEPDAPATPTDVTGWRARIRAEPVEDVTVRGLSPSTFLDVGLVLSPTVFDLLGGGPVEVLDWDVTNDESHAFSWPGERLGPNTREWRRAVLPDDGTAERSLEVVIEVTRWNPDDVANRSTSLYWMVDGRRASVAASWQGNDTADARLFVRGSDAARQQILTALRST